MSYCSPPSTRGASTLLSTDNPRATSLLAVANDVTMIVIITVKLNKQLLRLTYMQSYRRHQHYYRPQLLRYDH